MSASPKPGCWLAAPDIAFIEMAADLGDATLVLDVEHGTLGLADLDRLVPFARLRGLEVLVKVAGPQAKSIQQALVRHLWPTTKASVRTRCGGRRF